LQAILGFIVRNIWQQPPERLLMLSFLILKPVAEMHPQLFLKGNALLQPYAEKKIMTADPYKMQK